MSTTVNHGERRLAAFIHLGAMLLAFFDVSIAGIPYLNVLIPLVLLLAAREEKTPFMNAQIREVVRFQFITSLVMLVGLVGLVVLAISYPVITVPAMIVLLVLKVFTFLMPVIAACKLLFGKRNYAYPLMGSPRRKAYVDAKKARKSAPTDTRDILPPPSSAEDAEDADDNTRL